VNFIKVKFWCLGLAAALTIAPAALRAQGNPVVGAVRQTVARQGQNLTAGAQEMPAGKFNYAPTPAQMTFGHLILHIAQSNGLFCSRLSGEKAPSTGNLTEHSPKDQLIAAMKASFSFCDDALGKLNDSDLSAHVQMFGGRSMPKAGALIALTNDLADHYAQEAIYLRLNGQLPPTAMGRGMMGRGRRGGM
jgi:uncharacterized damage-inducible protein DinB